MVLYVLNHPINWVLQGVPKLRGRVRVPPLYRLEPRHFENYRVGGKPRRPTKHVTRKKKNNAKYILK